ncbi:MAG: 16S rRNA (guanine(527)-N(7))-methyltransferase RsmG, partial [Beijerinckiaceae bacterium]
MLSRDEVLSHLNVSRETLQRLDSYVHLLERWQKSINLVAPSTIPYVWHRHILDCAQLAKFHMDRAHWVDLGAGAGLPGIVVAILRQETSPNFNLHLVESNGKKCAFLREASRICG